jgi:hypothetical protein
MTTFERCMMSLSTLLVGVSGAVYAIMKYLMSPADPYAVVSHPLQPWMLDMHVLAAPILIFTVGLIVHDHIVAQLRKPTDRQGRRSGALALCSLLPMISTGYLIQVFTNDSARFICVVVHLTTGGFYLAAFAVHLVISRRIAARQRDAGGQTALTGLSISSTMLRTRAGAAAAARPKS